jgi:hypothetical protein
MPQKFIEDCADCQKERGTQKKKDRSRLTQIAAAMASSRDFISPIAEDNPRSTPKVVLRQAEKQESTLKDWAYEIGQIARRIK